MPKNNKIYPKPNKDVRLKYHNYHYMHGNAKEAIVADGGLVVLITIFCVAF